MTFTDDDAAMEVATEPPWAEDIEGVWHRRRDDFWDRDITADVRAHTLCGRDIWSCHVSSFHPSEIEDQVYCIDCAKAEAVHD